MRRTRLYLPLFAGLALLGAYEALTASAAVPFRDIADIREVLLGRGFVYVLFAAVAVLIVAGVRLFDAFIFDLLFSRRKQIHAPLLLREIISFLLYVFLFSTLISRLFGYSIRGLLATTTVVAAVIGLAMQETLGNLFSGISLHMERTFDVGDVVKSGTHIGVVERVGWRAARLRTFQNHIVVLPNSLISKERIEVFPRTNSNSNAVSIVAGYAEEPEHVISVLQRAATSVDGVSTKIPPLARIRAFLDSGVEYEVKYWTESYDQRDGIDAEVRRMAWYAFRRERIHIPLPQRVLHTFVDPLATRSADEDVSSRLEGVEMLKTLSGEERTLLAERTDSRSFGRGETIIRAGEAGGSMFVVHRGRVSVRIREHGSTREVAELGPGSVFGEMALLTGEVRTADVVAADDVVVLEIEKEALHPLLTNNPDLASQLSAHIGERRQQLESVRDAAEASETSSMAARIRHWFGLK